MKLNPGRELDALVAEKVMGWVSVQVADEDARCEVGWDFVGENPGSPNGLMLIPDYSTDIAAAWEVVEKLLNDQVDFTIDSFFDGGAITHSVRFNDVFLIYSDSAPHAICLAALEAVGIKL